MKKRAVRFNQFVPQEFCLKCQGCCRFAEADSVWAPCLLDEEIQDLLDNKELPAVMISLERRIRPVAHQGHENFLCPFLVMEDNACKIYDIRPFECQLYPFLISMRENKVYLTLDLHCPYIKEELQSPSLKEYIEYLTAFLNAPAQKALLKDNPHIIQAYEEVREVMELSASDEIS